MAGRSKTEAGKAGDMGDRRGSEGVQEGGGALCQLNRCVGFEQQPRHSFIDETADNIPLKVV